jgi:hypothetical protein
MEEGGVRRGIDQGTGAAVIRLASDVKLMSS